MIEIIPAVIPNSLDHLKESLSGVRGLAKTAQLDLTDGVYVTHRSWPFNASDKAQFQDMVRGKSKLPFADEFDFEVDLMMQQPEKVLGDWVKIGIARAIFHLESRHDFSEIKRVVNDTVELGIAIQNKTSIDRLDAYMHDVDYVQVMGIETIGKQGEPFSEHTLTTVQTLKEKYPDVTIQIDGGVDDSSAKQLALLGVDRLVSGSFILRSDDPKSAIETLRHV